MEKARLWHACGKKWHFHMLTPDCAFNRQKNKHALVLENESEGGIYVIYSKGRKMREGKMLVRLLHGSRILRKRKIAPAKRSKTIELVLKKARAMNRKGAHWHHHMLFPGCIFNKHPGKWSIVFEDPEEKRTFESLYAEEPVEDLRKIEVLFYKQKE